ncbi:M64 family metallopeptidase [Cellulomonas sp. KRMCY2]|uniref:M64 family metallopeptidase n=1 Tax=Cellulomonas sp. KRMCY2 TaxID=1304865 RepID=UPI0004B404ED|nr:M64 family metallopeptidase [Cellulomonas sp. KRMCY2]
MGAADGAVVTTTKVVDHGPDAARWTLVILAEGYRATELATFHADADAFVTKLFTTAPFAAMWCAINVYRVDVSSTDSGADEPAACADGGAGSGAVARTFFDATFCVAGTSRLLAGSDALAVATATAQVPEVDGTVVIVNSTRYGGAGGAVAWFSRAPAANEIGVHELGHAAFNLQDEYGDVINAWPGGEPPEPNVTSITDRATTKWAARIAAATALPTQPNPDCTTENAAASPVPAGTVGLFEGGVRAHCGLYHPEFDCRMRHLGQEFCVVCQDAIRRRLAPFLPAFSGPQVGAQFTGTLAAGGTTRWFTYDWPACWHVIWSVVPRSPVTPGESLTFNVQVERSSRERLTYWVSATNLTAAPLELEGRYAIVAKV